MSQIKVKLTKSLIGQHVKVEKIALSMGLRRVGREKLFKDNNCIRGMVNKIKHLVKYEVIEG